MAASKITGEKLLRKNLSRLERKLAPKAMANSLNRTGTKTRQQVVRDARAAGSRMKPKELRALVRMTQRARAPINLTAAVSRDAPATRERRAGVPLSPPFVVARFGGRRFQRAERRPSGYRGAGWSPGRPRSSSPNLPIISAEPRTADVRRVLQRSLIKAGREQMIKFLPGEFRAQLAKQLVKLNAKGRA